MFCFGDLNFRIADHGLHFIRSSINSGRLNLLWSKDQVMFWNEHMHTYTHPYSTHTNSCFTFLQLTMMKTKEPFLQEFEEGQLNFKPTYKFDRNSETYDSR